MGLQIFPVALGLGIKRRHLRNYHRGVGLNLTDYPAIVGAGYVFKILFFLGYAWRCPFPDVVHIAAVISKCEYIGATRLKQTAQYAKDMIQIGLFAQYQGHGHLSKSVFDGQALP